MSSSGGEAAGVGAFAQKYGPWVVAILALGWVLNRTDIHALLSALRHAPIAAFIATSAAMLVLNCGADTFAMFAVFARFGVNVPYRDLYLVRASTYLVAIINYHVGQALIIGYLYRRKRVPLLRASGFILFIIGINVGTLFLLASAGATRTTGSLAFLRFVPLVSAVGIVVYAAILIVKPPVLANRRVLAPLFEMGIGGHVLGVLVRLPHIFVLLVWHFVSLRMFGMRVSPGAALLYLPAYFAVSSLPINVSGLGAAQMVAVFFFAPYAVGDTEAARRAAVMAYSLTTSGISIILQLILGFVCLRWAAARGLRPEPIEGGEMPTTEAAAG